MIIFDEKKILVDKIHFCFHKDHKKQYEMKMNGYENDLILSNIHKNNGLNQE